MGDVFVIRARCRGPVAAELQTLCVCCLLGVIWSTVSKHSVKRDFPALPWSLLFIRACFYSSRAVTFGDPGGVGTGLLFGVWMVPELDPDLGCSQ